MQTDSQLTPAQIFSHIEAQPPLMRAEAARAYIGTEVDWAATFANGSETDPGRARVSFEFDPHNVRRFHGEVSLAEYPQLRRLRAGAPVQVRGTILEVDALFIKLEISKLLLAQPTGAEK